MRILIANRRLSSYTGTETVTRDLALALRSLGHQPVVYSPWLGGPAREIQAAGIPVYPEISLVPIVPDVLHGNHPKPLLDALFHFSGVPAVAVCHDATSPRDLPVVHPRILRFVGVDERCRLRIQQQPAIPPGRIEVHLNAVDLARFERRQPLPARPARALLFSNNASWRTHLPAVRAACRRASLPLDLLGGLAGQLSHPETVLGRYDIVFAKARCALEALATGSAVVLCDAGGLGPMVTSASVGQLRRMNLGQGLLTRPHSAGAILEELRRYDAADATRVCEMVRAEAGLKPSVENWLRLYEDVVEEAGRGLPGCREEQAARDQLRERWRWEARLERDEGRLRRLGRLPVVGRRLERIARRSASLWTG